MIYNWLLTKKKYTIGSIENSWEKEKPKTMDPSEYLTGDDDDSDGPPDQQNLKRRRSVQIGGPRPSPLNVHKDSHIIKKPPKFPSPQPPPYPGPEPVHSVSPRVIHTTTSEFKNVVQRLTGISSGDFLESSCGDVSPAARLASSENATPKGGNKLPEFFSLNDGKLAKSAEESGITDSGTTSSTNFYGFGRGMLPPGLALSLSPVGFTSWRVSSSQAKSLELAKSAEESGITDSGTTSSTNFSGQSTTTAPNMRNEEWYSFWKFLNERQRPLTLSGCRPNDVIDFLNMWQTSGDVEGLAGRLSVACEVLGIKPNPFQNVAVAAYLKTREKMTCLLVFSCNEHLDVDETSSFIEAISTELRNREVTPLAYNLSGREQLEADMLCRCNVAIIVLSDSSKPSMNHLVAILDHLKASNLAIIPVYYKTTLSEVCGTFEGIVTAPPSIVQKRRAVMAELASIDGHEWTKENHVTFTKDVVRSACLRLYIKSSENLERILTLLNDSQPSEVDIVGIWGMAGIGKTSIAREVFGILAPKYDLCYFLQDFDQMFHMKGLRQMRDDFYSKLFGEEKLIICGSDVKPSFMRDLFHKKSILVVLDDVSNARDAEAVVGGFGWFSQRHRIILTSRRKQVLLQCKVKDLHEMRKLSELESFRLCKQYLNEESGVISELISCSSGIPLALNVLGSSVSKQHINDMMEHLYSLRRNPPTEIQCAFRKSFDGLDENEKNIFLDLACFFRGDSSDHVVELLDACGFCTYLGICELIDESLISLQDDRIEIPVPFQDIARFIVHEEDEDPCERSRLWDSKDITDVLTNNSGTEAIEGIFLDTSHLTCELSPTVFGKMYRLRLLKFYCSTSGSQCKLNLPQGLETLPEELRLLHWENYPLGYLPERFNPENLIEVNMPYSNMKKLWEGKKNLEKLRKIILSHSIKLTDISMLSEALNLEQIDLEGCTSLVDVTIPRCGKLVSLNMKDCSHLRKLPAMVDLTSLKLLNLSGCSELEEIQDFAPHLKELYLAGTAIRELPLSINNINELVMLDLEHCKRLQQLPFRISNKRSTLELKLSGCTSLEILP